MDTEDIKAKLLAKRSVNELTGCWIWTGKVLPYNYGTIPYMGRSYVTHRLSYMAWVGTIPDGYVVRHKCDNPRCFNPEHLVPGTQRENLLDCVRSGRHAEKSKTHCKMGHEFTPENTRVNKNGTRFCKECRKGYSKINRPPTRQDFKTHCKRGHERTPENTYKEPNGYNKCRKCMRMKLTKRRQVIMKLMKTNPEQVGFREGDLPPEELK